MNANLPMTAKTLLFAVLAVLVFATGPVLASTDVFEVRDVPVDATADSAVTAREEAVRTGQREAFYRLLQRLTLRRDYSALPSLSDAAIGTYVRDFSVSGEKTSTVRYLARLHVRFEADDVRSLLREFGLPFSETLSKPALVLPVLANADEAILWREPNPWYQTWSTLSLPKAPVPLLIPVGDLSDLGTVTAEQALAPDSQALAAIATRYGAGASVVARADLDISGTPNIDLSVTRVSVTGESSGFTYRVEARSDDTIDTVMQRAAGIAMVLIEEDWKQQNLMRFNQGGVLPITVPIRSIGDWLDIREQLNEVAVVDRTDMILMSRDEVLINLHFLGTLDQLSRALEQRDLFLVEDQGVWTMIRRNGISSVVAQ